MNNAAEEVKNIITMSEQQAWAEIRKIQTSTWIGFKRQAELLYLMKTRYAEQGCTNEQFMKAAFEEVGYTNSWIYSMLAVLANKSIMYLANDVASKIAIDALIFLCRKKTMQIKGYKQKFNKLKNMAIAGKYITYGTARIVMWPKSERKTVHFFTASSDKGQLVYRSFVRNPSKQDVLLSILDMLEGKIDWKVDGNTKRTLKSRIQKIRRNK